MKSMSSNLPVNHRRRYNGRSLMHPQRHHIRPTRSQNNSQPPARNRVLYALLALTVIATGLLWRSGLIPLPPALSNYGGDALWALMVFLGIGFLLPKSSTGTVALLAMAFAWGVEFSQLYRAPWIDTIRATVPGKLVLGNTFAWPDLVAYVLGISFGAWVEWRLNRQAK